MPQPAPRMPDLACELPPHCVHWDAHQAHGLPSPRAFHSSVNSVTVSVVQTKNRNMAWLIFLFHCWANPTLCLQSVSRIQILLITFPTTLHLSLCLGYFSSHVIGLLTSISSLAIYCFLSTQNDVSKMWAKVLSPGLLPVLGSHRVLALLLPLWPVLSPLQAPWPSPCSLNMSWTMSWTCSLNDDPRMFALSFRSSSQGPHATLPETDLS